MLNTFAIFLVMGALANAAAVAIPEAGPGPDNFPATSPDPEAPQLVPRGYAEIIAKEIGNVTDFNVRVTTEASEGGVRGNVADTTDLTKDVISENDAPVESNSPQSIVDYFLFYATLQNFLMAKASNYPPYLIWSDDGCSNSPDFPAGFNFLDS